MITPRGAETAFAYKQPYIVPPAKEGWFLSIKSYIGPYFFKFTQKILLVFAYIFSFIFIDLRIKGTENIKKLPNGRLLIISNHKGIFDPLFIGMSLPFISRIYPLRFMAKDGFFDNFFSYLLFKNLLGSYPSFYGQGFDKSLNIPLKILYRGGTVVFFPEGKCFLEKGVAPFRPGASILMSAFPNMPILPISIYGSYKILPRLFKFQKPKISVNIGEPFTLADKTNIDPDIDPVELQRNEIEKLYKEIF